MDKGIIVVKVGTAVLAGESGKLDAGYIKSLSAQICALRDSGYKVILVSSGAIGAGMQVLGLSQRPQAINKLQAIAAVGQGKLMRLYEENFKAHGYHAAQVLLTSDDLGNRARCINAHETIKCIMNKFKAIPIINENDTTATEELKYSDNDNISHMVADLVGAQRLIILTDVDGVYSPVSNKVIGYFEYVKEDEIKKIVKGSKSKLGAGGMMSKIVAANIAKLLGITCTIAKGREKDVLLKIIRGDGVGTTFLPSYVGRTQTKKSWLASAPKSKGTIRVDDGAKAALVDRGKSLLAAGITNILGKFQAGDFVSIIDSNGKEFAKGEVSFSSDELNCVKGLKTCEIEKKILRKMSKDEVVHRDNLVILRPR
ncbi:glutamate 5-kinase [Candidatus Omnitrophota bacterium]